MCYTREVDDLVLLAFGYPPCMLLTMMISICVALVSLRYYVLLNELGKQFLITHQF